MHNDPLNSLYTERKESLLKRHGRRIAGGIACSFVVAFVMHLPVIKIVILWACQLVLLIFGRPHGAEKLDRLEDKVGHVIEKGKEVAHKHSPGQEGQPAAPLLAKALAPVKEAVAPVKEAVAVAKKVEDVKEKAAEGVQTIKKTGDKVADAIEHVGDKAKEGVGSMGTGIADALKARTEAKEKKDRATLEAHLKVKFGVDADPTWTLQRLRAETLNREVEWNRLHGPNARCPNPKCRMGFRIKTPRAELRRCAKCGTMYTDRQALACGKQESMHLFGR